MKIRVDHHLEWIYDWDSTHGVSLDVRPRTAARWRRVINDYMVLQRHIKARVQTKQQIKKVA